MRQPTAFRYVPEMPPLPEGARWANHVLEPGPACDDDCRRRHARAHELAQHPHPDPEAARWNATNMALTRLLAGWAERHAAEPAALRRWFPTGEAVFRFPAEPFVLLEWAVLGYRASPTAATVAEGLLASATFRRPELEALTRAVVAATPALLRVVGLSSARGMSFEPVSAPGPVVHVPDRASACVAHDGELVGGRLLATGTRWHLLRSIGPAVPARRAQALLDDLARACEAGDDPPLDHATLLRARPEVLTDLLVTHAV
jgi:hypothetical protein